MGQKKLSPSDLSMGSRLKYILGKEIREALPQSEGFIWHVNISVGEGVTTPKGYKYLNTSFSNFGKLDFIIFIEKRVQYTIDENKKVGYQILEGSSSRTSFKLGGWVELDLKRDTLTWYYDYNGNVTEDVKTAITMAML